MCPAGGGGSEGGTFGGTTGGTQGGTSGGGTTWFYDERNRIVGELERLNDELDRAAKVPKPDHHRIDFWRGDT